MDTQPVPVWLDLPVFQELPMSFHATFSTWISLMNFFYTQKEAFKQFFFYFSSNTFAF